MARREKERLDQRLLVLGLVSDLRQASALIMAGQVLVNDQRVDKPGTKVSPDATIRLRDHSRFVSRGGDKLWGAIEDLGLHALFNEAIVLDCGASTGGFTDCALQLGAHKVYALEVGFNQLAWKLRTDPRVVVREQTDIRLVEGIVDPALNLVLADISFNSLDRMLAAICRIVPKSGLHFILLVKPQFELAPDMIPEGGVVLSESSRAEALEKVKVALHREGLSFAASIDSRVPGREGNLEIFVHAHH